MIKNKKNILIFSLMILSIFIMSFISKEFPNYSLVIIATNLLLVAAISYFMFGYKKNIITILGKKITNYFLIFFLVYYIIFYLLGLVIGYYNNPIYPKGIISCLFYILDIVLLEIIRYIIIHKGSNSKSNLIVITIMMSLINFLLLVNLVKLNFLILISIIINNIFFTYLSYYFGSKVVLIYRFVLEGFLLIIPIVPKLPLTSIAFINILITTLIYYNLNKQYNSYEQTNNQRKFVSKKYQLIYLPFCLIFFFILILVSKEANIYLMGIASNSMSPKLRRGDAIIVKKIKNENEVSLSDIVVFEHNNRKIVHRVSKIVNRNGKKLYLTKGDNNKSSDNVTLSVKEIEGKVALKIPYLAYPTIEIKELINKGKEG